VRLRHANAAISAREFVGFPMNGVLAVVAACVTGDGYSMTANDGRFGRAFALTSPASPGDERGAILNTNASLPRARHA